MKTATIALAALLIFAPLQVAKAAPPADFDTQAQIADLKTRIELLEMQLAKLLAGEKRIIKDDLKKEKKIKNKKQKRMDEKDVVAGSPLPQAVIDLDAAWAEREAELDAKYKTPGKWKQVDDRAMKEYKRYQEKREKLLSN